MSRTSLFAAAIIFVTVASINLWALLAPATASDGPGAARTPAGPTAPRSDDSGDADMDGMADEHDICILTPEDPDGVDDDDGCPETDTAILSVTMDTVIEVEPGVPDPASAE